MHDQPKPALSEQHHTPLQADAACCNAKADPNLGWRNVLPGMLPETLNPATDCCSGWPLNKREREQVQDVYMSGLTTRREATTGLEPRVQRRWKYGSATGGLLGVHCPGLLRHDSYIYKLPSHVATVPLTLADDGCFTVSTRSKITH